MRGSMSDEDVNKVHELAEHEDQKTFQYMLQGKDNGRIKLGSAADNADIVQETQKKKGEREFTDLLLKQAALDALKDADKAISGMGAALTRMQENYNKTIKDIDRSDYLKDQLYRIDSLLKNGSEQDKLLYLLEQGYTQDQIDDIKADGSADTHLRGLGSDMADEYMSLRDKIERQAELFAKDKAEYDAEKIVTQAAYDKAVASGASQEELDSRLAKVNELDDQFEEVKNLYGKAVLDFKKEHEDFDTVLGEFVGNNEKYKDFENLADGYLEKDRMQNSKRITSIKEPFTNAATGELITVDKSLESDISNTESPPKLNTLEVDF